MFDLGIQELVVIFVVALLVFGPKRLPEIARSMGKGLGELKRALDGVKTQINSELHEVKDVKELKDLDPISLKNELFKNEDLFKINEEKPQALQTVAEQPKEQAAVPQKDSDKGDTSVNQPPPDQHKGER
ncbi:MAG TPA: Sec-independent protein translocase protein TatB [Dissulfurispiraceae bacterium]|nr:Sec-independent protein translocase protein TatB [Dissulfurispiraceae bacterium]